jgi:predicted membrane protein (TIGR00267 family)
MNLKSFLREAYNNDIARRSFTKNGFDGVLTVLGVLIALFLANVTDTKIIIFSCIGSGVAMCVSGLWGAYVTESAERDLRVQKLEKHLLRSLKDTKVKEASRKATIIVALVDGFTPIILTLILITPFFIAPLISVSSAYIYSLVLSVISISFLGFFIARLIKKNAVISILKMLSAGAVIILIMYLIEFFKIA